jgi:hypothetical protein
MATPCNCDTFTGNVMIDGSLGIGAAAPAGALDVAGSGAPVTAFVVPASDVYGTLVLRGGTAGTYWELAKLRSTDTSPNGFLLQAVNGSSTLPVLVASLTGQVGIGTTTPTQLLHLFGGNFMLQSNVTNPVAGGNSSITLATDGYGDALLTYGTASTGAFLVNQAGTQVLGVGLSGLFLGPAGTQNRKVADQNGCYYA